MKENEEFAEGCKRQYQLPFSRACSGRTKDCKYARFCGVHAGIVVTALRGPSSAEEDVGARIRNGIRYVCVDGTCAGSAVSLAPSSARTQATHVVICTGPSFTCRTNQEETRRAGDLRRACQGVDHLNFRFILLVFALPRDTQEQCTRLG